MRNAKTSYEINDIKDIDNIDEVEKFVIKNRLGLNGKIYSLKELGIILSITIGYVHKIELIALCKIKHQYVLNKFGKNKVEKIANIKRKYNIIIPVELY